MSIYFSSINSGSNGNSYYIGNKNEAILVDVGISCRELEKRMARLNLDIHKVKAVFISHEHSDHIKGLNVFIKKYKIPIYISKATLENSSLQIDHHLINYLTNEQEINIGELLISPFRKLHDAADPFSFTISFNQHKIGVFTDIGSICANLIKHFSHCNAVFLEANYDCEMLDNGLYPYFLKNRIRGGNGHLSNDEALSLFQNHKNDQLSHLILCHLSLKNNSPEIVNQIFSRDAGLTNVIVASRYQETELFSMKRSIIEELISTEKLNQTIEC